jgi:hypothetical protein
VIEQATAMGLELGRGPLRAAPGTLATDPMQRYRTGGARRDRSEPDQRRVAAGSSTTCGRRKSSSSKRRDRQARHARCSASGPGPRTRSARRPTRAPRAWSRRSRLGRPRFRGLARRHAARARLRRRDRPRRAARATARAPRRSRAAPAGHAALGARCARHRAALHAPGAGDRPRARRPLGRAGHRHRERQDARLQPPGGRGAGVFARRARALSLPDQGAGAGPAQVARPAARCGHGRIARARAARRLRRRHLDRGAAEAAAGGQPRPDEPGHAPPGHPAVPREVGDGSSAGSSTS